MLPVNTPAITLVAGTAITKNRLATLNASTGVADLCSATTIPIGQTQDDVDAGAPQGIRLPQAGSQVLTAAGAIVRGAIVYPAASGKVDDAVVTGGRAYGIALNAAAADGDLIAVLPCVGIAAANP